MFQRSTPDPRGGSQLSAGRLFLPLGIAFALGACAVVSPPVAAVTVVPGKDKDAAAFQQDDLICRRHALAHTGYGGPMQAGRRIGSTAPVVEAPVAAAAVPGDEVGYMQCMAARGDTVLADRFVYPPLNEAYGGEPSFPYEYPDSYGYPAGLYDGGFYGAFGWGGWHRYGWHSRGHQGGWGHVGGWSHAGFSHSGVGHGGFSGSGHH